METQGLPVFTLSSSGITPSTDSVQPQVLVTDQLANSVSAIDFDRILQQLSSNETGSIEPEVLPVAPPVNSPFPEILNHLPVTISSAAEVNQQATQKKFVSVSDENIEKTDTVIGSSPIKIDFILNQPPTEPSVLPDSSRAFSALPLAQGAILPKAPVRTESQPLEKLKPLASRKQDLSPQTNSGLPEINKVEVEPSLVRANVKIQAQQQSQQQSQQQPEFDLQVTRLVQSVASTTDLIQTSPNQIPPSPTTQGTAALQSVSLTNSASPTSQPFLQPEMAPRQFGQTVVQMLKQGDQKIEFRMDPPELGKVIMTVSTDRDTVSLQVVTATPAARDLLLQHADRLREALNSESLELGKMSVDVGSQKEADTSEQSTEYLPTADGGFESTSYQSAQDKFKVHGGRLLDHFV